MAIFIKHLPCHRQKIVPFPENFGSFKIGKNEVPVFRYYPERHASSMATDRLLVGMCAGNPLIEEEIICQAELSIKQRITFWDGVLHALPGSSSS